MNRIIQIKPNIKIIFFWCIFVCIYFLTGFESYAQVPVVFKISEGVKPNGLASLYGEYITGTTNVKFVKKDGSVAALQPAVQNDPAGRFCRVAFPPCLSPGSYAVYVQNANGWSTKALYINKADPKWLSEERAYPGLKMKLMGRNLDASQYAGLSNTKIQLVPSGGGSGLVISPTKTTPYCLDFIIPSTAINGTYNIEVKTNSDEFGGDWVRLNNASESPATITNTVITIESAPSDTTALLMGVTWAKDFNWTFIKNVRNAPYNATGNGSTDDTQAIQNAIDDVANNGGGVVYIPNGSYNIVAGLSMKKNVILKGESNVNTILVYSPVNTINGYRYYMIESDGSKDDVSSAKRTGMQGFYNFRATIQSSSNTLAELYIAEIGGGRADPWPVDVAYLTATKMFVYQCVVDLPYISLKWHGFDFGGAGPVLVAENKFKLCSGPWDHAVKSNFLVHDNSWDYCSAQVSLSSDKLLLYNNNLTVHKVPGLNDKAEVHGFFLQEPIYQFLMWNSYVANNTVTGCFNAGNQGEGISFDSPMYKLAGQAISSTSTSVDISNFKTSSQRWDQPWQILVVSGKGMGQMRSVTNTITSATQHFTVNKPWDIQPDNTSKLIVCSLHTGAVCEGNNVYDNVGIAYEFWTGTYDCIFSNNTASNTEGIAIEGTYFDSDVWPFYAPLQFCQIRDNNVTGVSATQSYTSVSLYTDDENATAWAPAIYGTELRANTIDRSACSNATGWIAPTAAGFNSTTANRITGGTSILASLYDGNTVKNSQYGIGINRAMESDAAIRGTTFLNIGSQNIYDQGIRTARLSNTPDPITCVGLLRDPENPANPVTGLNYSYYEGNWNTLPDFTVFTPVKKGTVNNFDLTPRNKDIQYGFSFTGYVNIPADGQYTFYTSSDDGSRIYIGNTLVADNDGLHGTREKSGTIGLKAGKHAITVTFFQQGGGASLSVSYEGPSLTKTAIPASALYRAIPVNTLFTSQTPDNVFTDGPYELGMKFQTSDSGTVTGIKYYKASGESGSHTGRIWSVSGTVLTSVAFNNESSSGWQEASLSTPLSIPAKTTYVVTVNSNTAYGASIQGLGQVITNGSLSSIADSANGVYGSIGVYPTSTYKNSNYFRDIEFVKATQWTNVSTARIYPRTGFSSRMQGGKFQGSNDNSGWTDLGSVTAAPPESGWTTYNLTSTTTWRYLRYLSPTGGYGNISELEFYNGSTKLVGTPIGTAGSWSNAGNTKEKALDGDVSTFFDAPTGDNNYVGIDTQGTTAARIAGEPGKLHTLSILDVRIYPNPAGNEVTIDSETPWIKLSILDINGKEKLIRTGYNRTEKIELNGMQPGVYVIKIQTQEGIQTKKLIIY